MSKFKYGSAFFHWLEDQLLMVEDYAYRGTNFRGYPDLPLPAGAQWGDISKKNNQEMDFFLYFMFSNFYGS